MGKRGRGRVGDRRDGGAGGRGGVPGHAAEHEGVGSEQARGIGLGAVSRWWVERRRRPGQWRRLRLGLGLGLGQGLRVRRYACFVRGALTAGGSSGVVGTALAEGASKATWRRRAQRRPRSGASAQAEEPARV